MDPLFKVNGMFPVYSTGQEGFTFEAIPESMAYILDGAGWKVFKRNGVAVSLIKIDKIEGVPEFKEKIKLTSAKIPYDLIKKVTAFFTTVYKKNKSEAVGYLYYNPTSQEWDFIPPVQTASAASAHFAEAIPPKGRDGWLVAGTIHSHGSMSAFHSGTDDNDEKNFDGVHITIGRVDSTPEYSYSVMTQGARLKYDNPADLLDYDPTEVPNAWLEAIKLKEPDTIDDKAIGKRVEKLYKKYLNGHVSEELYLKELEVLEEKAEDKPLIDATTSWPPYKGVGFLDSSRFSRTNRWGGD